MFNKKTCLVMLSAGGQRVKGTASIKNKMHEIDPSHVKETSFTCSLVMN